jgi:hypothetical protein
MATELKTFKARFRMYLNPSTDSNELTKYLLDNLSFVEDPSLDKDKSSYEATILSFGSKEPRFSSKEITSIILKSDMVREVQEIPISD